MNILAKLIRRNRGNDSRHFIVLDAQKIVYGRVPKVANSSIKAALARFLEGPVDPAVKKTKDHFWQKSTGRQTRMVKKAEALKLNEQNFSFSFVRNPFDRVVSCYNNKVISNPVVSAPMEAMNLYHGMPFDEFVRTLARTPDDKMDIHLLPQASILKIDGQLIPKFVGRLENIQEDWRKLAETMAEKGLPTLGKLPSKNVRRKKSEDVVAYYESSEILELIHERYRDDIETFYAGVAISDLVARRGGKGMPPLIAT